MRDRLCGRNDTSILDAQTQTRQFQVLQVQQFLGYVRYPSSIVGKHGFNRVPSPPHHRAVAAVTASFRSEWRRALSADPGSSMDSLKDGTDGR